MSIEEGRIVGAPAIKVEMFVKKNWPWLLGAGLSIAGVAIWLTGKYLLERKKRKAEEVAMLEGIIADGVEGDDQTAAVLVNGQELGRVLGDEAVEAATELEGEVEDPNLKAALGAVAAAAGEASTSKGKRK